MVVAETISSSPVAPRKNRRKLSKKNSLSTDAVDLEVVDHAIDDEMQQDNLAEEILDSSIPTSFPGGGADDDDLMIETEDVTLTSAPAFPPLPASAVQATLKSETRRIGIPPHRMTPLKKDWISIFGPLTEILGLQVRMNVQRKSVEVRVSTCALLMRPIRLMTH